MVTLKELIDKYTWKEICPCFLKLYPKQRKNLQGYRGVFKKLKVLEPKIKNKRKLLIECCPCHNSNSYYTYVHGVTPKRRGNTWSLMFTDWQEWLSMKIWPATLYSYGEADIICHCLYELTFCGYDNSDIQESVKLLGQKIKRPEKH